MGKKSSKKNNSLILTENNRVNALYKKVTNYIDHARYHVQKTIDTEMVKAYWLIGQDIVQEEQYGNKRAEYGKKILKRLSVKLQEKYKNGFSVDILEKASKFFFF